MKALYQRPYGKLQSLEIPEWKCEHIAMDFVIGLPKLRRGSTAIWVVIDHLTKYAHFISITSDHDSKFISRFWTSLQKELGHEIKL